MESAGTSDNQVFRAIARVIVQTHPIVRHNDYTRWFATGEAALDEVRHLTVQFSVFSHEFLAAQLRKVINAPDLRRYRDGKEILLNELGVGFTRDGTVDGGRFHFEAGHFEWLLRFAAPLGIGFADLGRRRHATPGTHAFCETLLRIYGSDDPFTAAGASYALENWAAAGFWKELIAGLRAFRSRECPDLTLDFWVWHDALEDRHAGHTGDELEHALGDPSFDGALFLAGAREMLDGVQRFWGGLWNDHLASEVRAPGAGRIRAQPREEHPGGPVA